MSNPMHDQRYVTLRTHLARERERAGVTQADLAGRLSKPQSYVSKYERGERRLDLIELLDVLRALSIDPLAFTEALIRKIY